jgi:hypothetical protein
MLAYACLYLCQRLYILRFCFAFDTDEILEKFGGEMIGIELEIYMMLFKKSTHTTFTCAICKVFSILRVDFTSLSTIFYICILTACFTPSLQFTGAFRIFVKFRFVFFLITFCTNFQLGISYCMFLI